MGEKESEERAEVERICLNNTRRNTQYFFVNFIISVYFELEHMADETLTVVKSKLFNILLF